MKPLVGIAQYNTLRSATVLVNVQYGTVQPLSGPRLHMEKCGSVQGEELTTGDEWGQNKAGDLIRELTFNASAVS